MSSSTKSTSATCTLISRELVLLLDVLAARPDLKLVLMSATLQAERFSAFFGGCPVVTVPGRTYPVEKLHLEDVLQVTGEWDQVRDRAEQAAVCACQHHRRCGHACF
jgi:HrpA-like RNA helicase